MSRSQAILLWSECRIMSAWMHDHAGDPTSASAAFVQMDVSVKSFENKSGWVRILNYFPDFSGLIFSCR